MLCSVEVKNNLIFHLNLKVNVAGSLLVLPKDKILRATTG